MLARACSLQADSLFGEMTQRDPEFGAQLDPGNGRAPYRTGDLMIFTPLLPRRSFRPARRSPSSLCVRTTALARLQSRIRRKRRNICANTVGAGSMFLGQPARDNPAWRARMQFYGGEDPATGSAAGCAISYLVRHGLVAPSEQEFTFSKESKLAAQAIYFWLRISFPARSAMCGLGAALFALQRGSFSCRNTHAFNRI